MAMDRQSSLGAAARMRERFEEPAGAARILAEIDALAPVIVAEASKGEAERRISPVIMERLGAAGLYRATAPRSHGGLEVDLATIGTIIRRLARLDASVGWVAGVRMVVQLGLPLLPRDRYEAVMGDGPDVLLNASNQPGGQAEATPEGLRVTGRWPFASGCEDSHWMALACVLTRDGAPLPGPMEGVPAMRMVLVPRRHIRIEDTWRALGLEATASHHVVVDGAVIPESDAIDVGSARSCLPGPLQGRAMQIAALMHCPLALGVAEGALDDLVAAAKAGRRLLGSATALKDSEVFQFQLGQAQAELRAAEALTDAETARLWKDAEAGLLQPGLPHPALLQSAAWITQACLRVTQKCFELCGASAVYESSSLQRRLRDLSTAAQHTHVQGRNYIPASRLLLQ